MAELSLELISLEHNDSLNLPLRPHSNTSLTEFAEENDLLVYCDHVYIAKLNSDKPYRINSILVNDNIVEFSCFTDGTIHFRDSGERDCRIFSECYGFIQMTIIITEENHSVLYETEQIQVMVKKGKHNDAVRRMAKYVYDNYASLIENNQGIADTFSGPEEQASKTLESNLRLLEHISLILEENYRYFKANSRFTTKQEESIDYFEKLQFVSGNTIRYITQHPERLVRIPFNSGIKVGDFYYQPSKTLITSSRPSYDIYENQMLIGFILTLKRELLRIEKEISELINKTPQKPKEIDEYVSSSFFILDNTVRELKKSLEFVKVLNHRYSNLYDAYSEILPVEKKFVNYLPKFTAIFKRVPQYHQIYDCMVSWFSKGTYEMNEEKTLLTQVNVSKLYELYVLSKILNFYKGKDINQNRMKQTEATRITYQMPRGSKYINTNCNNKFVLEDEESVVTVYYQPVIFSDGNNLNSELGLYRNTSIRFASTEEEYAFGNRSYYTPDYVVKYKKRTENGSKYLIADAKFSSFKTTMKSHVPALSFKYLFSVSNKNPEDSISGLCIINGCSFFDDDYDKVATVYNQSSSPWEIKPYAEVFTLSEKNESNALEHDFLMRMSFDRYMSDGFQIPSSNTTEIKYPKEIKKESVETVLENDTLDGIAFEPDTIAVEKKPKKQKEKQTFEDKHSLPITSLGLKFGFDNTLIQMGISTIGDLIPNNSRDDIKDFNRKQRRELEGALKDKLKIQLS